MAHVRLYGPALVSLVVAVIWAAGLRGSAVVVIALLAMSVAFVVHVREQIHRLRERGHARIQ